jgi:tetratricopeptide (TPR) repeat protein
VRWRIVIAAVLLCTLAVPAESRQTLDDYQRLLAQYASEPDAAIHVLLTTSSWTRRSIEENVRACLPMKAGFAGDASPCDSRRRALSAMLHAEAAIQLSTSDVPRAAFHMEMSRRIGVQVKDRPAFSEKWFELLTMLPLSAGDIRTARDIVSEAASRLEHSAVPPFLSGVISEVSTMFDFKNLRDPMPPYDRQVSRMRAGMASAARDYGRALAVNPAFTRARLRLGWTLVALEEPGAEKALEMATAAPDRWTRYLSRLFLGSLATRRGQLDRALELYQVARQEGPGFQSACLAVSQTLYALGNQSRSDATAEDCLSVADEDPWWSYRTGGVELSLIGDLRKEVARP